MLCEFGFRSVSQDVNQDTESNQGTKGGEKKASIYSFFCLSCGLCVLVMIGFQPCVVFTNAKLVCELLQIAMVS